MTDKEKIADNVEKYYVDYTKGKLDDIVYWYEIGQHSYTHTMRLYAIEWAYTKLKRKEDTLSQNRFELLRTSYMEAKKYIHELKEIKKGDPMCGKL